MLTSSKEFKMASEKLTIVYRAFQNLATSVEKVLYLQNNKSWLEKDFNINVDNLITHWMGKK